MSNTYELRKKLVEIARRNVGKTEVTRNQAPWIKPLWTATSYPEGHAERQPYCAAGMAWALREWLKLPEVLKALKMTPAQAEKWRCKSASVFHAGDNSWLGWARAKGLDIYGPKANFHTGDFIIYNYSHIEMFVDDLEQGAIQCIGYNTDPGAGRDGDGCWEKPRHRGKIQCAIRILE